MELIRNAYQAIKYHITCSQDEQIERQISRMRLGLTDAERREQSRHEWLRKAVLQLAVVMVVGLYAIGKLSA